MTTAIIANLEKLLDGPRDGALLRYSLGNEWLKAEQWEQAAARFREAVDKDPKYSAAWKLLGKALAEGGPVAEALDTYRQGIDKAEAKGDIKAAKEMRVFAKRIEKQLAGE